MFSHSTLVTEIVNGAPERTLDPASLVAIALIALAFCGAMLLRHIHPAPDRRR